MKQTSRRLIVFVMVFSIISFYVFSSTTNVFAASEKVTISVSKISETEISLKIETSKISKIKYYEIFLNGKKISTYNTSKKSLTLKISDLEKDDYECYVKVFYDTKNKSITSNKVSFSTKVESPKPTATIQPTGAISSDPISTASAEPTATASIQPTATVSPEPTNTVSAEPTATVSPVPTNTVSPEPTETTVEVSAVPTVSPENPTANPTPTNGIEAPEEDIYADGIANAPELTSGMVPVKYDPYINEWFVCSKSDKEWYNYNKNSKKWANIMLLDTLETAKHSNKEIKELNKTMGKNLGQYLSGEQVVTMGSMFVWIPRYAYCITSGYHSNSQGKIDIEFLSGTSVTSSVAGRKFVKTPGNGNWLIHPAFTKNTDNGGWYEEIKGFWAAKFEASGSKESIQFLPGEEIFTDLDIEGSYKSALTISGSNSEFYGLDGDSTNSHLTKNSEWGAIAYLTTSVYGRETTEISTNTNAFYTGGDYEKTAYKNNVSQTTTNNIYGIYDLSGGASEFVSAYTPYLHADSDLSPSIVNAPYYMKNSYERGQYSDNETYNSNSKKYGDAMFETSNNGNGSNSWFKDTSNFSDMNYFLRGGASFEKSDAGLFNFDGAPGYAFPYHSFRVCIIMK